PVMPWTSSRVLLSTRTLKFSPPKSLVTHRFQRAVAGGKPIVDPRRAWGRMRTIANNNYFDASAATSGKYDSDQNVFPRDCALEAMRNQGRFSFFVIGPAENEGAA